MTISTTGNRIAYNGDGASVAFTFPYPFFDNAEILVYLNGSATPEVTGFSVSGAGAGSGTVTFIAAPIAGTNNVLLVGNPSQLQLTRLPENDPLPSKSVETMVDRAVRSIQRLRDLISRSISFSDGDSGSSTTTFPVAALRLGRMPVFNITDGGVDVSSFTYTQVESAVAAAYGAGSTADAVAFLQAGTGAVARSVQAKEREWVSVKDFGAVGDGSADDTAAIQAAINYVLSVRGELYFPNNNAGQFYKVTAPLVITNSLRITGAGPKGVLIYAVGLSAAQYVLDFNCAAVNNVEHIRVEGLTIRSDNSQPRGIRINNASYVLVKDVRLHSLRDGIVFDGTRTFSNSFEQVITYAITDTGARFAAGFAGGGHYQFTGCTFTGANGFSVVPTALTDGLSLVACNFEQCLTASLYIGGTVRGLSINGCRTEGGDTHDFLINPEPGEEVTGLAINGCFFTSDSGASNSIRLGGAGGRVRGFDISGNHVQYAGIGTSFVLLNGEGDSGVVSGNRFAQSNTTPINAQRAGVVVFGNENATGKCAEYWGASDWGVVQGTWAPIDGSGAGLALTGASGRYTKIGRIVMWQAVFTYPVTANTAAAEIGGLPFVIGGISGTTEGRSGAHVDVSNAGVALGILQGFTSNTEFAFYNPTALTPILNSALSGKTLYCSGTYTL